MTNPAADNPTDDPAPEAAATPNFKRSWRIVTVAGVLGMMYYRCCLMGAPRTKFLVELGATPFHFGLISGLGSLTMACQLLAGVWSNRLRRRKPVWMTLFILHRLSFLGVLAAPGLFHNTASRLWWIIAILCLHHALLNLGDPLWLSWMTDLVPKERFNRHWGRRQRVITIGSILTQIGIALWFGSYEAHGQVIRGFILLGLLGVSLGIIDILLFSFVPEPEHQQHRAVSLVKIFAEPFRHRSFRPFMVFQIYWTFAIMLAAPFFPVYLIGELGFSALSVQMLLVVHAVGMAAVSGRWGRMCDTHGYKPVLQFVAFFKFLVPLTYILLPPVFPLAFPVLLVLFTLDGMLNAGTNLALKGFALRCTPRRNRAMYIATITFLSMGLAGAVASMLAGSCITPLTKAFTLHWGPYTFSGYHVVFIASCLLRAGGIPVALRLHEPGSSRVADMIGSWRRRTRSDNASPQP